MRTVKESDLKTLLAIKPEDIDMVMLKLMFADTEKKKKQFEFTDVMIMPAGTMGVKQATTTTVGRYICNLFIFDKVRGILGYINKPFDKKTTRGFVKKLTTALLEEKVTMEDYKDFLDRLNWFSFGTVTFSSPPFNADEVICPPKTAKLRDQLFTKFSKEIANGDIHVVSDIEKQLIASAKEELKGTAIADYFNSGARGTFENNYKTMVLMRGLVKDPNHPGKFFASTDNLVDGNSSGNHHILANILLAAAGGRAIETRQSGYLSKQLTAAFQGVTLDVADSDCATTRSMEVTITEENGNDYLFRYVKEGSKLVLLSTDNIASYYGKKVKMRSPYFCREGKYCSRCYGSLPYVLGIDRIGLTFNAVGENLKNLSLKGFHDTTIKTNKLDIMKAISPV